MKYEKQISDERYNIILERYTKYLETVSDVNTTPVKVYDPLGQKSLDELKLIREISKTLQLKKDEDLRKAAQAAAAEAEAREAKETAEATETTDAEVTEITESEVTDKPEEKNEKKKE